MTKALNPAERALLLSTLTYHQPLDWGRCACGWTEWDCSHPEHVIEIFEDACFFLMAPPVLYDQDAEG